MDEELKALLALDGASFEFGAGYVAEFEVKATGKTKQRPHGVSYALVFRPKGEEPWVRFDNAHAVRRPGGPYVKRVQGSRPLASKRKGSLADPTNSPRR